MMISIASLKIEKIYSVNKLNQLNIISIIKTNYLNIEMRTVVPSNVMSVYQDMC